MSEAAPETAGSPLLRWLAAVVANATVVTALLVYFGWQRSEVMARRIGIDESILGMSTRDYVLRSVGQVLALLLTISLAGLLWLALDRRLGRAVATPTRTVRIVLALLSLAWLILPAAAWAAGFVPAVRAQAYVALPFALGAGVLLAFYAGRLRGAGPQPHDAALRGCVAVLVGVALFAGTSRYATVLGVELADAINPRALTKVTVYSPVRLHLGAPGVVESALPKPAPKQEKPYLYRYSGLRLLDHVGGRYFLISDVWTRRDGTVMVVPDDSPARLEFTHR
ncbi:hypothetical protein GCM10027589_46680 [Actinocorallia lasiicapitis]